tara:strand:+ start:491 stop:754 length:264 start_codon:yes stop_codon:yes gene_type:complete
MKFNIYVLASTFLLIISIILIIIFNRYSYEQLQHGSNECLIKTDRLTGSACSITDHPRCERNYQLCSETADYEKDNIDLLIDSLSDD